VVDSYCRLSAEASLDRLKTSAQSGLTHDEVVARRQRHGQNVLAEGKRPSLVARFLQQFNDLLIIVLIIAALLAFYLDDFRAGTILLIIVFVNALIGFYQENKAERILESLKKIIQTPAVVIRDGSRMEVGQADLVPGDIVYLGEGSAVPADMRLIRTSSFSTNDFILTGESLPQEKFAEVVHDKEVPLTEQENVVFMGLTVAKGNATGVVYATGMETEIGRLARKSETIEHDQSPLQMEINTLAASLTKIAGVIAVSLFFLNLILNIDQSENIRLTIELSILFGISIAAACVPQGLPAQISVALSLGVGRLAERSAVVKKLSSVETLGSTTVICSDKTGTLTKNEMTITHCISFDAGGEGCRPRVLDVNGIGYDPEGEITEAGRVIDDDTFHQHKQFFEDGFLASNGRVMPPDAEHEHWYAIGDPTEAAFTPLTIKAGLDPTDLEERFPVLQELPFDSTRKRMTIVRRHNGKAIAYMKGALESVLDVCGSMKLDGDMVQLDESLRRDVLKEGEHMSDQALRVIALAYRDFDGGEESWTEDSEKDFVFAGFVAMLDPPREGVIESIGSVYDGGMRVMMITGDSEITAGAIARKIGMRDHGGQLPVYNDRAMQALSDAELQNLLESRSVIFSRVSPEDKYRIVSLLKEMGDVVAVTGDGVNDTLSLKKADIGVAMGRTGSEVAKEASEIVLLDDNFRTLTTAVAEGRTIFANLKKTILSSITSNNAELTCVLLGFVGMAMGLPAPITAVQILAIDLVGEMLPLTAITFDKAEKRLMKKPPRNLDDHILKRRNLINVIFYGFWMGASGFLSFVMVYLYGSGTVEAGQSAAYVGIIFCQFMNILSRRVEGTIFTSYLFSNPQLWGSFAISLVAISVLIYVPAVAIWFNFAPLTIFDLLFPISGAIIFLMLHEVGKLLSLK